MTALGISQLPKTVLEEGGRRYATLLGRIEAAAGRAGRDPGEITLVGVAKKQPTERTLAAIAAGLRVIGQSYIQEARAMRPEIEAALAADPTSEDLRLEWHMVGRLQRNKASLAARLFDAIESVDRPELVETLARRAETEGRPVDVMLQVSLCGEPQKGGCEPDALPALARQVLGCASLRLGGFMTLPASNPDPEAARPVFRRLRELRGELARTLPALGSAALSMGMSGDFEVAIEEGATLVRVGTALFGERLVAGRPGEKPTRGD
ncbi:MAG: YggS family pyridoxal phosphate-dependent enzyme [bacterium]|nr:YggS family pyridoxal phosphate-dependent enzyme [Deltaproteobacteria bacterium]MCP4903620.1 YggS family pyridoxal phosphate-dependent enzyme [bacterium]